MLNTANISEYFSIDRFCLLIKNSLLQGYRSLITISSAIALVIVFAGIVVSQLGNEFYNYWFALLLFGWGIILSSRVFKPLHDKTQNGSYLLIPASSIEKLLSALLMTTLGFILFLLIFMSLLSIVLGLLQSVLGQQISAIFNPLSADVWRFIGTYISVQAFCFLGAVWFRSFHIAKTILFIGLIVIICALFSLLVFMVFFGPYFADDIDKNEVFHVLWNVSQDKLVFFHKTLDILLPIACWIIAWLRFREVQVSEGV